MGKTGSFSSEYYRVGTGQECPLSTLPFNVELKAPAKVSGLEKETNSIQIRKKAELSLQNDETLYGSPKDQSPHITLSLSPSSSLSPSLPASPPLSASLLLPSLFHTHLKLISSTNLQKTKETQNGFCICTLLMKNLKLK